VHEETIAQLGELGFARNESLAYLTLLESADTDGLTGYEVASRSGIPRSAVYTVLRKLEDAGAAFAVGDRPSRYHPTPPARLIEHMSRSTQTKLTRLGTTLEKLPSVPRPEPIWIVARYDEVLARADSMIRTAEHSVYLSVWDRELARLMPSLESLNGHRELHRVLHSPDGIAAEPPGFHCWCDDVEGDQEKAGWSHKLLVVVDRREAMIGGSEPDADNQAVWTSNPSLVDVATNHIILDITLLARKLDRDCIGDVALMMRPHLPTAG